MGKIKSAASQMTLGYGWLTTGLFGVSKMLARFQRFDWLVSLGCLVLLGFFAWHGFHGPRGYDHLAKLQTKAKKLDSELAEVLGTRNEIEARVVLMRPESVDPDMLEELARTQLELSRPNELVVRYAQ